MLFRNRYRIESARLQSWDYSSPGYYFITLVAHDRNNIFGHIDGGRVQLNDHGIIVSKCWYELPEHYSNVRLDEFIVMPNHIHGIIQITATEDFNENTVLKNHDLFADSNIDSHIDSNIVETGLRPVSTKNQPPKNQPSKNQPTKNQSIARRKRHGLSEFIRAFKSFASRRINELQKTPGSPLWQSRFFDRIIHDRKELFLIRRYIKENPATWETDGEFGNNMDNGKQKQPWFVYLP